MADYLFLTIKNWAHFNPRTDIKKPSWFRLENTFLEDPEFFDFSLEEKAAWIYILSQASKKSSPTVKIYPGHAEQVCRIPNASFMSAIEKLIQMTALVVDSDYQPEDPLRFQKAEARTLLKTAVANGTLVRSKTCEQCCEPSERIQGHHTDYSRPLDVMWLCTTCHGKEHAKKPVQIRSDRVQIRSLKNTDPGTTNERTNEHNERTNNIAHSVPEMSVKEIELVYQKFPRKEGKARGIKTLRAQKNPATDFPIMIKAVEKYASLQVGKDKQYIKQFSSWASCWRDYTEPDVGTCTITKPKDWLQEMVDKERAEKANGGTQMNGLSFA